MSDKQTLSRWLRTPEVYEENLERPSSQQWRESLLAEFDGAETKQPKPTETLPPRPIELRHVLVMAPFGLGLFLIGWMFGSGSLSVDKLSHISPLVWMFIAVGGGLGFMLNRGLKYGRWS